MNNLSSYLIILITFTSIVFSQEIRFHKLLITSSDPIIYERCVIKVNEQSDSFVKEKLDKSGRTISIELFDKGKYFSWAMMYSFIKYEYTDSSIIEIFCNNIGQPAETEEAQYFGNKREYITKNNEIIKEYKYFNDKLLSVGKTKSVNNDSKPLVEYFYYSGCKPNLNYFLERDFQENKEYLLDLIHKNNVKK